jgi:ABC-2 type transport system ATP-binding protein
MTCVVLGRASEIFDILGPNGAGKPTTAECIIGLRVPDTGTMRVMGLDPQNKRYALHAIEGHNSRQALCLGSSVLARSWTSTTPSTATPPTRTRSWRPLDLGEKRRAFYRSLSGGQEQRVSVALALIGNPKVAVVDEYGGR